MQPYIHQFANFLRVHMDSIAVGIVATLLMIYGAYINNYFKKITRSIPYVGRFALFSPAVAGPFFKRSVRIFAPCDESVVANAAAFRKYR